jgi:hypothetical protein
VDDRPIQQDADVEFQASTMSSKMRASMALCACVFLASLMLRAQGGASVPGARMPPAPVQPLPFSHRFHMDLSLLECRDCHVQADAGKLMTFPSTEICMSCHRSTPAGVPSLQKLAALAATGTPIPWVRVYQLPDYVYWQHDVHLRPDITCANCHGPVDERDVLAQETNILTMDGCVGCHEKRQVFMDCGDCHEPRR